MHIVIILGSIREERKTHKLAVYLKNILMQQNIQVTLIDLQELPLSGFGGVDQYPENREHIKQVLLQADGMIFVSPEYHHTYSSTLKNFTEHYWAEFSRKPIGVAAASAGKYAGIQASLHLQSLVLALGGYPIPVRLLIPEIQNAFDAANLPSDGIAENAKSFVAELLLLVSALIQHRKNIE